MSRNTIGAFIFLAFSIAYTILAINIEAPNQDKALSPRTFPIALGVFRFHCFHSHVIFLKQNLGKNKLFYSLVYYSSFGFVDAVIWLF